METPPPSAPFDLFQGVTVIHPVHFWKSIEADIAAGPGADASDLANGERDRIDLGAVHSIVHTSGTGGRPKGAVLTYGNHLWSAFGSVLNLGLQDGDRWLACLPLFHVGGLAVLLRSVIYGIPVVVHESFDPAAVNRSIDSGETTIVSVVSAMLQRMLDQRGERAYPATLRCVLVGGGPVPAPLLEECARRAVPVVQTYGLTEAASQVATLSLEDAPRKPGSAGMPLFPTDIRILDRDGNVSQPTVVPSTCATAIRSTARQSLPPFSAADTDCRLHS